MAKKVRFNGISTVVSNLQILTELESLSYNKDKFTESKNTESAADSPGWFSILKMLITCIGFL